MEDRDIGVSGEMAGQGVFVNTYTHSLDSKKRVTIPSDWRELAGVPRRLFVLPGVNDKCLCVYPAREMTRRLEKLRNLSIADEKGRQLARTLASRSDLVPWDTQGRIRIKDELLDFADLKNQVVMVGTFDGFELWNPDRWKEQSTSMDQPKLGDAARYVGF
ncbi:MAG TPA: division/cell wall cluster transcriptional repressor MraZ [Kiritimatiellia bacterium]|nr:division/cell wall cluster transcriptional repressor MraZ [Kiritimatiellia bacterium]